MYFYVMIGLAASAALVAGLYLAFDGRFEPVQRILVIGIFVSAVLGFFLVKVQKTAVRTAGFLVSIVSFSLLILFFYQRFVTEGTLQKVLFFFGAAIVGELLLFIIAWASRENKIFGGIGSIVCVAAVFLILWMYVDKSPVTAACVVVPLFYLYISTICYLDSEEQASPALLEKSGMVLNVVGLFLSLFGRYSYSWRR